MRIRFRFSLTTLLMLPLLVGIGIKWYRGPHEYTLEEPLTPATLRETNGPDPFARCVVTHPRKTSFWAYRNLNGSPTLHGLEISIGFRGEKTQTEFRGGRRSGAFRYWNAEGELVCEGQFENDEPVGQWVYYRYDVAYQRLEYGGDRQNEVRNRYDFDRLAERRVRARGTDEVWLTAWYWQPDRQKRLEGRLFKDRPVGRWHWWDEEGRQILAVTFQNGVPEEFMGRSKLEQFMEAEFDTEFQNSSLESVMRHLTHVGMPMLIECPNDHLPQIRRLGINTGGDFRGGLALFLALRRAGLTLDTRTDSDGTEALVIVPVGDE